MRVVNVCWRWVRKLVQRKEMRELAQHPMTAIYLTDQDERVHRLMRIERLRISEPGRESY